MVLRTIRQFLSFLRAALKTPLFLTNIVYACLLGAGLEPAGPHSRVFPSPDQDLARENWKGFLRKNL